MVYVKFTSAIGGGAQVFCYAGYRVVIRVSSVNNVVPVVIFFAITDVDYLVFMRNQNRFSIGEPDLYQAAFSGDHNRMHK